MIDPVQLNSALQQAQQAASADRLQSTATPAAGGASFEEMFSRLIQDVDQAQKVADDSIKSLATGDNQALHDVVLKLEEADLTFKLMKEIRDKLVQAYQEVISLQS